MLGRLAQERNRTFCLFPLPLFASNERVDRGEYDVCTYCGRSIFPGVAECPYCHSYTDGKGPLGLEPDRPRPKWFVVVAWVAVAAMLLPLVWALWRLFRR